MAFWKRYCVRGNGLIRARAKKRDLSLTFLSDGSSHVSRGRDSIYYRLNSSLLVAMIPSQYANDDTFLLMLPCLSSPFPLPSLTSRGTFDFTVLLATSL